MEYALTKDQVKEFRRRGYLVVRQLLSSIELRLILALEDVVYADAIALAKVKAIDEDLPAGTKFHFDMLGPNERSSACVEAVVNADLTVSIKVISWIGGVQPKLLDLGRSPKITVPVAQLLQTRVADHLINQAHYKMPGDNISFAWHQDLENRLNFDPEWKDINGSGSFVQVIIAVDESNASNGGLIVIPESHNSFLQLHKVTTETEKEAIVGSMYDVPNQALMLDLKPGDAVFLHPLVLHKSDANKSRRSRKVFVNGFAFPGANNRPYPGRGSAVTVDLAVPNNIDLASLEREASSH